MDQEIKIAICDDEKPIRDYIEKCVREVKPDACVLQCWSRAEITTQSRLEITNLSRLEIANAAADSFL